MPEHRLTVVVSAGQSRNPQKRDLELQVAEGAAKLDGIQVLQVPHLYDLKSDSQSFETLRAVKNDLVFISWLFDRAAHWVLDRNGVRGQPGEVELKDADQEELEDEETSDNQDDQSDEVRVIASQPRPDRTIYGLDFRASSVAQEFVDEIQRIASLAQDYDDSGGTPLTLETLQRHDAPTNDTYVGAPPVEHQEESVATLFGNSSLVSIDEHPGRRWYPVIDFSRCTNCMECIDFCLFGVYGIDSVETIVVEQADNCRKGCPACSRVCPQNAIIFPQHKTPAIAGAPVDTGGLKIDLSKLFGAPENDEDAAAAASRERDEQLILAGREAVGTSVGLRERIDDTKSQEKDDLDDLIDELNELDL